MGRYIVAMQQQHAHGRVQDAQSIWPEGWGVYSLTRGSQVRFRGECVAKLYVFAGVVVTGTVAMAPPAVEGVAALTP
jgi:hypothetical protein